MKYSILISIFLFVLSNHLHALQIDIERVKGQVGLKITNPHRDGIYIQGGDADGIQIDDVKATGVEVNNSIQTSGDFNTATISTFPAIVANQKNPLKTYHDIRLSGSKIIGSLDHLYLQIDSDNNAFDDDVFGIFSANKSDPLFKVFSTGGVTYKGSMSGGKVSATNTNDSNPDLEAGGTRGIVSSQVGNTNSELRIEANKNIYVSMGNNGGSSKFAVVGNNYSEDIFAVFNNGEVRVANGVVHGSDRNIKKNIAPINYKSILNKVVNLPVYKWDYKSNDIRHIGPMAQDFYKEFNLGTSDKTISAIDADGIALAAIKGLYEKMEAELKVKNDQITILIERLNKLETKISSE